MGQIFSYHFSENFWPVSPTGTLDGDSFFTPDEMDIYNESGNNIFYDSQYQVAGNRGQITDEAMWGNPLDLNTGYIEFSFFNIGEGNGTGVNDVTFDFAWSDDGVPAVSDFVYFYAEDSDGRSSFFDLSLASAAESGTRALSS
ncbi:MAG: hypothetical protein ABGX16_06415 [Pirellulales bacterium]